MMLCFTSFALNRFSRNWKISFAYNNLDITGCEDRNWRFMVSLAHLSRLDCDIDLPFCLRVSNYSWIFSFLIRVRVNLDIVMQISTTVTRIIALVRSNCWYQEDPIYPYLVVGLQLQVHEQFSKGRYWQHWRALNGSKFFPCSNELCNTVMYFDRAGIL